MKNSFYQEIKQKFYYRNNNQLDKECYSCPWIEGGIVFSIQHLHICCIGSPGGGWQKICNYSGRNFPIVEINAMRDIIRKENQNEKKFPRCEGCGLLEKRKWNQIDYINLINISHFTKCNIDCINDFRYNLFIQIESEDL